MKHVKFLLLISLALLVFSCDNDIENRSNYDDLIAPEEPVFSSELPTFPATSLHILQREYANLSNSLEKSASVLTLAEYIEQRLLELYPETAYDGMMQEATEEMDKFEEEYSQYLTELNEYYLSIGADSLVVTENDYREFTTLEDEIEFLEMTEDEINEFYKLRSSGNFREFSNKRCVR